MNKPGTTHKRKRVAATVLVVLLLIACILLFPLPVRDVDREFVIQRDAIRLRSVQPVMLDWWWRPFYDAKLIADRSPTWHLHSELGLDFSKLGTLGFSFMNKSEVQNLPWGQWYEDGNVLIEITNQSSWHKKPQPGLRMNVHHGTMGAQGYRVYIYRCLLGRFAQYSIEWVS